MGERIIDDDGNIDFTDQDGRTQFFDEDGNTTYDVLAQNVRDVRRIKIFTRGKWVYR